MVVVVVVFVVAFVAVMVDFMSKRDGRKSPWSMRWSILRSSRWLDVAVVVRRCGQLLLCLKFKKMEGRHFDSRCSSKCQVVVYD